MTTSTTIRPGAVPFELGAGAVGIVVIHGLGGSPAEYRPWAEEMARQGYRVHAMRVAGHGIDISTLARSTVAEWQTSVDQAIDELKRHVSTVVLLGVSFGAVLAIDAAVRRADINAVVAVNPALQYRRGGVFQAIGLRIMRLWTSTYRKPGLTPDMIGYYKWSGSMVAWPIITIERSKRFQHQIVAEAKKTWRYPICVLMSDDDDYVDLAAVRRTFPASQSFVEIDTIPFHGHRPFRDERARQWISARVIKFITGLAD